MTSIRSIRRFAWNTSLGLCSLLVVAMHWNKPYYYHTQLYYWLIQIPLLIEHTLFFYVGYKVFLWENLGITSWKIMADVIFTFKLTKWSID